MPGYCYFKPRSVPLSEIQEVVLTVDEYEAIRLKDLEEKIGRAQIRKSEENFFTEQRAKRAAAGRSVSFAQRNFAQSLEYPSFNGSTR